MTAADKCERCGAEHDEGTEVLTALANQLIGRFWKSAGDAPNVAIIVAAVNVAASAWISDGESDDPEQFGELCREQFKDVQQTIAELAGKVQN